MSLFQSNLRKQIRNLPKILKSVKIIQYYSILFNTNWSAHCSKRHPLQSSDVDELGKVDDEDNDGERKATQKKAKTAAPGHRQKATSGDNGAQKAKKARVAPKGK